jgi:hypothetical protein
MVLTTGELEVAVDSRRRHPLRRSHRQLLPTSLLTLLPCFFSDQQASTSTALSTTRPYPSSSSLQVLPPRPSSRVVSLHQSLNSLQATQNGTPLPFYTSNTPSPASQTSQTPVVRRTGLPLLIAPACVLSPLPHHLVPNELAHRLPSADLYHVGSHRPFDRFLVRKLPPQPLPRPQVPPSPYRHLDRYHHRRLPLRLWYRPRCRHEGYGRTHHCGQEL